MALTELRTPRLRLRAWRDEDREPFAAMNADPRVMRWFPSTQDRAQSDETVDRAMKLHEERGFTSWAVEVLESERGPADFVGFAIEYKEPNGDKFYPLKNRLSFPGPGGALDPNQKSSRLSPIQKFRWVHFPRNAELDGEFVYKVSPVFMNGAGELSYGESQRVGIELRRETYPRQLNVAFTRGFVSAVQGAPMAIHARTSATVFSSQVGG